MAETTADVRRDIEMTRDRIADTLQQLEAKTNVMQIVRDHPWPALALAVGAGVLLSGSGSDIKAAAATASATKGASSKIGTVLDDVVANLMSGLSVAFQDRIEALVNEVKAAIGAPVTPRTGNGAADRSAFASQGNLSGSQMASQTYVASPTSAGGPTGGMTAGGAPSGGSSGGSPGAPPSASGGGLGGGSTGEPSGGMSAPGAGGQGSAGFGSGGMSASQGGSWAPQSAEAMRAD